MTGRPGHNHGVSTAGRLAPRLLVVAVLALGLVGMHHLVIAACHHAAGHSAHVSTVATTGIHEHTAADSVPVVPLPVPQDLPEAPGGLVGAAATCLAVLLMIVLLVLPHVLARVRRCWQMSARQPLVRVASAVIKPPDLTLLSVSRT